VSSFVVSFGSFFENLEAPTMPTKDATDSDEFEEDDEVVAPLPGRISSLRDSKGGRKSKRPSKGRMSHRQSTILDVKQNHELEMLTKQVRSK
jgi:hypothetical protein